MTEKLQKYITPYPNREGFVMGIDSYRKDDNTFSSAFTVMNIGTGEIVCMYKGGDETDFKEQIEVIKAFYKIPDNHIIKEL